MSDSPLIRAIVSRLAEVGYREVETPFRVASVRFDFAAALQGQGGRSLDLVLIVDTTVIQDGDDGGERIRDNLEALSQALDLSHSRLVLTVILAGARLVPAHIAAVSEICRVSVIESVDLTPEGAPATVMAAADLDDQLRVLLPLQLEDYSEGVADPIEELTKAVPPSIDKNTFEALLMASARGERSVSRVLRELLTNALTHGTPS